LKRHCDKNSAITTIAPAEFIQMKHKNDCVDVQYKQKDTINNTSAKLILAADGIQSGIRKQLDLETIIKSYQRTAIICNITPEFKHNNCAYERLSKNGPTAILPFVNNRCGFVWTVAEEKASDILAMPDNDFLLQAQQQFGYRLGKFVKAGKRSSYPLYLVTVPKQVKNRVILIGNAAHGMSPVSAQGLNLAIRDVASLVDILEKALKNNNDIGSPKVLLDYQNTVEKDQKQTIKYTDDLMSWFKIDQPIVNLSRSIGLVALDQMSQLKSDLYTRASGYRGGTAKLLRQQ
jgi:2-octaprenyl-6-methoxyphenol hydroxylase